MNNEPEWSLITVTYNSAPALRQFWQSGGPPSWCEWIVVDNASSDNTPGVARDLGAKVIENGRNVGFGRANNRGYTNASAERVGFINPDVTVDYSSLRRISSTVDDRSALVAPQLLNSDGSLQPNGRGTPSLANKIAHRINPDSVDGSYRVFAAPKEHRPVVFLIGAVVLGHRSVFDRLGTRGPWNERYFIYYEDSDLGLRARALGIDNLVIGSERWVHGWARETSGLRLRPWAREVSSMVKFYSAHPRMLFRLPDISLSHWW